MSQGVGPILTLVKKIKKFCEVRQKHIFRYETQNLPPLLVKFSQFCQQKKNRKNKEFAQIEKICKSFGK